MAQTKARHYFRIFRYFSFADKTPEQILVETQWATAVVLIGVGLFAHSLLPVFPAAALLLGLHAYTREAGSIGRFSTGCHRIGAGTRRARKSRLFGRLVGDAGCSARWAITP